MGERTPAETTFLHFLSALCLFAAARAFPHVTGVFLVVVVPPTVPAQLSAAAAACCGRNLSSTELQPSNISYPVPNGHTYLCRLTAAKARFDNRHSTSAPTPTLTVVSGSGARGTSDPPNRQCYPPHFMRECIPPNLHDPQRAKGPLDRRSKRLSFPHFFLRRKKCGRRRPPPRQGETDSPPGRRNPPRAKGSLNRRFEWFSLVTFFLQKKTTDAPNL